MILKASQVVKKEVNFDHIHNRRHTWDIFDDRGVLLDDQTSIFVII